MSDQNTLGNLNVELGVVDHGIDGRLAAIRAAMDQTAAAFRRADQEFATGAKSALAFASDIKNLERELKSLQRTMDAIQGFTPKAVFAAAKAQRRSDEESLQRHLRGMEEKDRAERAYTEQFNANSRRRGEQSIREFRQADEAQRAHADRTERENKRIIESERIIEQMRRNRAFATAEMERNPVARQFHGKLLSSGTLGDPNSQIAQMRAMEAVAQRYGTAMASAGSRGAMGWLQLSYAIQDAQYSMAAVVNNVPQILMGFGVGAGIAGAAQIAAVAISVLADNWSKLQRYFGMGGVEKAADAIKRLREEIEQAATASNTFELAERERQEAAIQRQRAARPKAQEDAAKAAGEAITEGNRERILQVILGKNPAALNSDAGLAGKRSELASAIAEADTQWMPGVPQSPAHIAMHKAKIAQKRKEVEAEKRHAAERLLANAENGDRGQRELLAGILEGTGNARDKDLAAELRNPGSTEERNKAGDDEDKRNERLLKKRQSDREKLARRILKSGDGNLTPEQRETARTEKFQSMLEKMRQEQIGEHADAENMTPVAAAQDLDLKRRGLSDVLNKALDRFLKSDAAAEMFRMGAFASGNFLDSLPKELADQLRDAPNAITHHGQRRLRQAITDRAVQHGETEGTAAEAIIAENAKRNAAEEFRAKKEKRRQEREAIREEKTFRREAEEDAKNAAPGVATDAERMILEGMVGGKSAFSSRIDAFGAIRKQLMEKGMSDDEASAAAGEIAGDAHRRVGERIAAKEDMMRGRRSEVIGITEMANKIQSAVGGDEMLGNSRKQTSLQERMVNLLAQRNASGDPFGKSN